MDPLPQLPPTRLPGRFVLGRGFREENQLLKAAPLGASYPRIHLVTASRSSSADEHQHYGLGCLGWYRPISPPPGSRIFVIEPQRSSATMEHSTPFARSASISVLR